MSNRDDARLERIYGSEDHHAIFNGDTAIVPWPRAPRLRDPAAGEALRRWLAEPVHLFDIDPRLLLANQPRVVRHHYFHYAERSGLAYKVFGRTSADPNSELNRFPVVEAAGDGRYRIRSGHHRALVALIKGAALRCRIVSRAPDGDAVAVTPSLLVGTSADVPVVDLATSQPGSGPHDDAELAARQVREHKTVLVRTPQAAQRVLSLLRCEPTWAAELMRRSFPDVEIVQTEPAANLGWNTPSKYELMGSPTYCEICGDSATRLSAAESTGESYWSCEEHRDPNVEPIVRRYSSHTGRPAAP